MAPGIAVYISQEPSFRYYYSWLAPRLRGVSLCALPVGGKGVVVVVFTKLNRLEHRARFARPGMANNRHGTEQVGN